MKMLEETHRRPIGEELSYICDRLKAEEGDILAKSLRRGLLEIYKAVVLHELQTGRIDRAEAELLLGSRVVERNVAAGRGTASAAPAQRPGPRKMPRRRKR
jgi:hypothetical protein